MASVARDWLTAIFFSVQLLCLPLLLSLPAALELVLFSIENKAILISLCTLYFFLSFLLFSLRISSLLKHFLKIYCLKIGCANEELHPPFFIFFIFYQNRICYSFILQSPVILCTLFFHSFFLFTYLILYLKCVGQPPSLVKPTSFIDVYPILFK